MARGFFGSYLEYGCMVASAVIFAEKWWSERLPSLLEILSGPEIVSFRLFPTDPGQGPSQNYPKSRLRDWVCFDGRGIKTFHGHVPSEPESNFRLVRDHSIGEHFISRARSVLQAQEIIWPHSGHRERRVEGISWFCSRKIASLSSSTKITSSFQFTIDISVFRKWGRREFNFSSEWNWR